MKNIVKTKEKGKKLKPIVKAIICYAVVFSLLFVSFYLFKRANEVVSITTSKIDYSLNGKVDYKVRLKNNDYYNEEYLKNGMQYIASLIKSIDINFNYEAHASQKLDYKYKYNVSATTLVTSKNDKSKIIFENKEYLEEDTNKEISAKSFTINTPISIDYDKYNDYIVSYKKEYLLNSLFDLIINIHVETEGQSDIANKPFHEEKDFIITIPLSEQIIDISINSSKYQKSGLIIGQKNKTMKSKALYASSIISAVISGVVLINVLIKKINDNRKRSEYNKTISKYLKEYDRAIVNTHKSNIAEEKFVQVIEISTIQEMLDLHDNFQLPILYYEVIKDKKSYFVVIKDNILYRLTISKETLEKNRSKHDKK